MSYWQNQFSTGYINPTPKPHLDITASQSSEIVSILSAGTFFGALLAAPIADRLGRRLALIVSSVVFIFGVVLQTAATEIPLFVAGSTYPNVWRGNPPQICLGSHNSKFFLEEAIANSRLGFFAGLGVGLVSALSMSLFQ